jgi:hypothetical protein
MKRVTGIGGIFFKANDPDKWRDWYRVHLGIECEKEVGAIFNGGERMILPPSSFSSDAIVLARSLLPRSDSLGDIDVKVLLHFQSAET